ncbi:MAG TPA: xanthine dehydrogenase family protein molybdopterin-binding subunit [Candidatus Eisenbacteria bacterium]|nr:xanthine dehydrogenase family protein molybdopterin-binding subunit [Candidatus Eisenbacteria bacterium]
MGKRTFQYVGKSVPRVDGWDKVTGRAKFLSDLRLPGMLYGKILRSPYPHARIVSLDASRAEALAGVAAVVTAADLHDVNPIYNGRPVVAMEKVRYVGEPVAAVAATDPTVAEEAATLIEVHYDELPAVIGIDAARAPGAPLVHENKVDNICAHENVVRGDIREGFSQSDLVLEDHFTFPMVYHYAMEPHAVAADWSDDGVMVWSSAQHPFQVRNDIARVFRLPLSQVRMMITYLGGGYGSKSYTKFEPLAVALARKAKAPVRLCNSVADSMMTVRRHAAKVRIKTGFRKDGTIMAREAEIFLDTGAYDDNGPQVTARAATRVLGPYRIPNIRTDAYAVYTNSASAGSFRAIGAPQVIFAGESQIDAAAIRLGLDPAELRLKNLLGKGEELRPGLKGMDANLRYSLKKLVSASQWKKTRSKHGKPAGLACAVTNAGATPVSVALARLQADGNVVVLAGSTEMGQGVRTVLAQIAGEELGLPLERIRIPGADTKTTPYDSSTGSSRSTTCMGHAVQLAARDLKRQLIKIAADAFRVKPAEVQVQDGFLMSGEARLSFKEALERRFGKGAGGELIGRGDTGPDLTNHQLPVFWEVGMAMVELDVDRETGEIEIKRLVSLADVGKAIHPDGCVGQEEGAAMMGIGHTLFEEMLYDQNGALLNPNLIDYRVPRFGDLPDEFHTVLVENEDGPGPFGVRGMGEGGLLSIAPSVTNALERGTGVRLRDLPLTPERVWRALRETKG